MKRSILRNGEMISTARRLYHSTFPLEIRLKIRGTLFTNLRKLRIQNYLEKVGFLICNDYLTTNSLNLEETLKRSNGKHIGLHKFVEQDEIKPALNLHGQELEGFHSYVTTTETVVLDIASPGFSFRNNHFLDKELNVIGEVRKEEDYKFDLFPIYYHKLQRPAKLKGTVAYLSDPDPKNYYHWLCRTLPLLNIYQKFFDLQEIDFFYIGQFTLFDFHKESLIKAGIAMNKLTQDACIADRLVIAINNRSINFGDPINKEAYLYSRNLFYNPMVNLISKRIRI
jgi:hypothetical protein